MQDYERSIQQLNNENAARIKFVDWAAWVVIAILVILAVI